MVLKDGAWELEKFSVSLSNVVCSVLERKLKMDHEWELLIRNDARAGDRADTFDLARL